ncbi:MAG: VWA domain-containing protein [Planctomycetota bacterium]
MRKFYMAVVCFIMLVSLVIPQAVCEEDNLNQLLKKLSAAVSAQDWSMASTAIREIGRVNNEKAVKAIIQSAVLVDNMDVFKTCHEVLNSITDKEAVTYMYTQVLKASDWRIRALIVEVIVKHETDEAFDTLIKIIEDYKNRQEVHITAINALKKSKRKQETIDAFIDLLEKVEREKGKLWVELRTTLTELTGDDYDKASQWREYWAVRKEEIKAGYNPDNSPETAKVGKNVGPITSIDDEKKKAPTFFGSEILSRRILFIIDCSTSMLAKDPALGPPPSREDDTSDNGERGSGTEASPKQPDPKRNPQPKPDPQPNPQPRGGGMGGGGMMGGGAAEQERFGGDPSLPEDRKRMVRVKNELVKCITALDSKTKFNIIAYSTTVRVWKNGLLYANNQNKQDAIKMVNGLVHMGWTHTDEAFQKAFEDQEFDTIYFLSDGQPAKQSGNISAESVIEFVRNANKLRKVTIHTFGFANAKNAVAMNAGEMMRLLKGLAEETGGTFTDIYW